MATLICRNPVCPQRDIVKTYRPSAPSPEIAAALAALPPGRAPAVSAVPMNLVWTCGACGQPCEVTESEES